MSELVPLDKLYKFQYGKGNTNPNNGGPYPVYGSNGVIGYYTEYNSENGPVIGHIGANCGEVVFARGKHFVTYNGIICKIRAGVDPLFGYYSLLSKQLNKLVRGSAQPFISYDLLHCIKIALPSPAKQRLIGKILGDIDAKINCNNRINAELETMAKTLYDYWFVQFDFSGENGKPYKSSGGRMAYSSTLKRDIPEGWWGGTLKDLVSLEYGKPLKADTRSGAGYPVIGSSGVMDYHADYLVSGPGIVVGRKGTVGAVTYIHDNFFPIDTTYFVRPRLDIKFYYLKFLLESLGMQKMNSDSAVPGLNREAVLRSTLVRPRLEEIKKFESVVEPVFEKQKIISKENQHLTQLRDWLLPMLMNGQVTVV